MNEKDKEIIFGLASSMTGIPVTELHKETQFKNILGSLKFMEFLIKVEETLCIEIQDEMLNFFSLPTFHALFDYIQKEE